jgi:hypothetical protein
LVADRATAPTPLAERLFRRLKPLVMAESEMLGFAIIS